MSTSYNRILVRSPNWIGDQVLAFPFFYYLRRNFPRAWITAACAPWVESVQYRNLVDEVVVIEKPKHASMIERIKAVESTSLLLTRKGPWDLGICLPPSFSSAWIMRCSGVSRRRGYVADFRGFLLNERISAQGNEALHRAEEYLKLLPEGVQIDGPVEDFWGVYPQNPLDEKIPGVLSEFDAEKAWPEARPIEPPSGPYWVIAPGSMAESRRWPASSFISLARILVKETGWKGVIVGGTAESQIAQELMRDPSLQLSDWTGRGTPSDYWKVFRGAQVSVCNDSGLAHVAALCGSPVEIVWGAGRVAKTQPIGPGKVNITVNPVDCWPCEKNQCERREGLKLECLSGLTPERVWQGICSLRSSES